MGMTVQDLAIRPLVGGPEVAVEQAVVRPAGLAGDREVLLYHPNLLQRMGSNRIRALTAWTVDMVGTGDFTVTDQHNDRTVEFTFNPDLEADVTVDEFGDQVPCADLGDDMAYNLTLMTGKRVRVGQKALGWLTGEIEPSPMERAQAPLHMITDATVAWLNDLRAEAGHAEPVDHTPLRPSFTVVGGAAPNIEQLWVGKTLAIGSGRYKITRGTPRCAVPGRQPHDPEEPTGIDEELFAHPETPKGPKNKALIGVYLVPLLEPGDTTTIANNDSVVLNPA